MKRIEPKPTRRVDSAPEPPLALDDDDEDFDTLDTVELVVTEENGYSSRVICIAIDGDTSGTTAGSSSASPRATR